MESPTAKSLADRWYDSAAGAGPVTGPGWLQELEQDAAEQFQISGLPDRKVEAWKYTPLRLLESLAPDLNTGAAVDSLGAGFPAPLSSRALSVDIANGRLPPDLSCNCEGVSLMPLDEGLSAHEHRLRPLFEQTRISGRDKAFTALNTALLRTGLVVHVAAGVDAGQVLLRWARGGEARQLDQFRLVVLLEAGARLELLEHYESTGDAEQAMNLVLHADLSGGACLDHVRVQNESDGAVLLTSCSVRQAENSIYRHHGFDLGGGLVRHELEVSLNGSEARAELGGAFVLDGKRHVDNHLSIEHGSPDCGSEQFYRGVLGGRSRGVFSGRTLIQPGADGSRVQQSNANLLLSALAEVDTKPELEIYADEVEASHGATVGQLDESGVFYLRSRGLSEDQARHMLIAAFCHAVTDRLADRELASRIAAMIDVAMPENKREKK